MIRMQLTNILVYKYESQKTSLATYSVFKKPKYVNINIWKHVSHYETLNLKIINLENYF